MLGNKSTNKLVIYPSSKLMHHWRSNPLYPHMCIPCPQRTTVEVLATPYPGFMWLLRDKRVPFMLFPHNCSRMLKGNPGLIREAREENASCSQLLCYCTLWYRCTALLKLQTNGRNQTPWYKSHMTPPSARQGWYKFPRRVTKIPRQHRNCFFSTNQF